MHPTTLHSVKLTEKIRQILSCDSVRISCCHSDMFVVAGWDRNTKDDLGQWFCDGKAVDFSYLEERCIASGRTEDELIASVEHYKKLLNMTWDDYFKSLTLAT